MGSTDPERTGYPSADSWPARRHAEVNLEQRLSAIQSKEVVRHPAAGLTGTCYGGVASIDALHTYVDTGHNRTTHALSRRLQVRALRLPWASGDAVTLSRVLEATKNDALTAAFLSRLTQHEQLFSPHHLSILIPLIQELAQADYEDHAVAAMRFTLHCLNNSWPTVAKSLRSVATPKATYDACNETASRLQSLYAVVKAMSRSVRISRTNGPLVPLCRKTKISLEEALAAAGRLRGG